MTTAQRISYASILLVLILAAFSGALADNNGGSSYSRYGLGDIRYFPSGISDGMGGASLAVLPTDDINLMNPAAWGRITRARFTIGALYEGFSTSDAAQSNYLSGMSFNGLGLAFPVAPQSGIVLSFGMTPYSRINYNVKSTDTTGDLSYTLQYVGNGGVSSAYIGLSASPMSSLYVGVKFDYYFGNLNYITRQLFDGNYTSADFTRTLQVHGAGVTVGAAWNGLRQILNLPANEALTVGAVFSSGASLSTTTQRTYLFSTSSYTTHDTLLSPGGTTKIPFSAGGGLSFATERYILAADIMFQNWSSFLLDDASSTEIRNSTRISAGGELVPQRDPGAPAFQKWRYRLGVFYNSSYYNLRNEPVNESGVTGGIGIPVIGDTKLNIGLGISRRGTTSNMLEKDTIYRLSFTLSGGEMWFVRPPEE
jgi:hypothetical protein